MNDPRGNWPAWVAKARHDLLCIRNNLAADDVPWDTVCFHAQQTAEKMLKAFLVFHGVQPRKTHDLFALLGECMALEATVVELRDCCRTLNPFSVDVRYPPIFADPDEAEARAATAAARQVYDTILDSLPEPDHGT